MYDKRTDHQLIQIADASLADAALRSGHHLACKPGCAQCCVGIFAISALDAERLRAGLAELEPEKAKRIRQRVAQSLKQMQEGFPGGWKSGILNPDDPAFEEFGNDLVCPVLDPQTLTCDLYASRPMTCRTFGPPVVNEEGIGVCELCFTDATEAEILAAAVDVSFLEEEERLSSQSGSTVTTVALALRGR